MQLCEQVVELTETTKQAKVSLPDEEFENLVKAKTFTEQKMTLANALAKAEKVVTSTDPFDLLTFEPSQLVECSSVITKVAKRMEDLDSYIAEQEEEIKKDGDPETFATQMFDALGQFAELSEEILEVDNVKAS